MMIYWFLETTIKKDKEKKIKENRTKKSTESNQTNDLTLDLPLPDNEANEKNEKKPLKKRVVKKVKEVLNNKNEKIQEKNIEKSTSISKTSKSGWWERKI